MVLQLDASTSKPWSKQGVIIRPQRSKKLSRPHVAAKTPGCSRGFDGDEVRTTTLATQATSHTAHMSAGQRCRDAEHAGRKQEGKGLTTARRPCFQEQCRSDRAVTQRLAGERPSVLQRSLCLFTECQTTTASCSASTCTSTEHFVHSTISMVG